MCRPSCLHSCLLFFAVVCDARSAFLRWVCPLLVSLPVLLFLGELLGTEMILVKLGLAGAERAGNRSSSSWRLLHHRFSPTPKANGSSAQKSSGAHCCRHRVRFSEVPDIPNATREAGRFWCRQGQVRFNRPGRLWCRARSGQGSGEGIPTTRFGTLHHGSGETSSQKRFGEVSKEH